MHRMKMAVVFLVVSSATAIAQQMPMPINASDLRWGPAPNVLPPGAQIAVVSGDPSKDALYVVRLKLPSNYELPAHNHPAMGSGTADTGSPANAVWAPADGTLQYSKSPNTTMSTAAIGNVGGSQPHNNEAPYLVLNFIIALVGIYPSRN